MNRRRPPIPRPKPHIAAISKQPSAAVQATAARLNAAFALHQQGRLDQAEAIYNEMLESQPPNFDALQLLAIIAVQRKNYVAAVELLDQVLKINPDHAASLNNRGYALRGLKRLEEALQSYDRALKIKPDYAEALNNRGSALHDLRRNEEALESYDRALKIKPDYAEALYNLGNALLDLKRAEEALESYDGALRIKPDDAEALNNRGNALLELGRNEEALESHDRALKIKPDLEFLYGTWLHTKMNICDWRDVQNQISRLIEKVGCDEKASSPFPVLALSSSLALQRKAAEIWVRARHPVNNALPRIAKRPVRDKMRIGYFSADFRNHPVAYLTAELFERHDRSRFEVTAFSFGPDTKDEMRERTAAALDSFIDVRNQSDKDVALLARNLGIDIAVDLGGHTQNSRTGIFALRAAPLQVSYLGSPGTMGAEYIDYVIADATIIPEPDRQYYSERIAYLPSYQANDTRRRIADKAFSRDDMGLPQTGFVYCCFNNNYKIMPRTFDCWMRILKQVEGSVLWLSEVNAKAADNLRKEAVLRGVGAERLIFAKRMPLLAEHLARHRLADLFLDTLPYNAQTTASDALWAGLPVLTCLGQTFAGRVAASLLNAIRLPELITSTPQAYEALAIELATDRNKLRGIKRKLANNRLTTPLFDARLFTRHIEAAYTAMYERYQADRAPEHIFVQPDDVHTRS